MATQVLDAMDYSPVATRKTLLLVWQNPATRQFSKVGRFDALEGTRYAFRYLPSAESTPGFAPLVEYPRSDAVYVSDEVPAFFANRILSSERPDFDRYLDWLGLAGLKADEIPVEVLARTGGGRATDTFHVVDLPVAFDDRFVSRFFVSGVRYADGSDVTVSALQNGADLTLKLEEGNPYNAKAVLVDTAASRTVGHVPDWLCADVHDLIKRGWTVSAVAERVNPSAPAHIRVLCRIDARP